MMRSFIKHTHINLYKCKSLVDDESHNENSIERERYVYVRFLSVCIQNLNIHIMLCSFGLLLVTIWWAYNGGDANQFRLASYEAITG